MVAKVITQINKCGITKCDKDITGKAGYSRIDQGRSHQYMYQHKDYK